jgi:hypothetical protein
MTQQNKRAQEEMVGLVLIMLVVAVIFVIFLGIYLRNSSKGQISDSKEISTFLESLTEYTTECGQSPQFPIKLSQLVMNCYSNSNANCIGNDGKGCEVLRETIKNAINASWNFASDSPTKGYLFQVLKETNSGEVDVVSPITNFQTTSQIMSAEKPFPGGIILRLEIYY